MAGIGKVDIFNESVEDWTSRMERLEEYMVANGIDDQKKVSVLVSVMRPKTCTLLKSLTTPAKPNTMTFQEIKNVLANHLAPSPLVIVEGFRFGKRDQR